jgi:uncharacterized coiled-coil DUF342 family protein
MISIARNARDILALHERLFTQLSKVDKEVRWRKTARRDPEKIQEAIEKIAGVFLTEVSLCSLFRADL